MSFTFNWAGVQGINDMTPKDRDQQIRSDGAAWGSALRGYEKQVADKEYADMLEGRSKSVGRVAEIQQEIARLEQRNDFIDRQLAQLGGQAVAPAPVQPYGGQGWDINASKAQNYYE